MYDEEVSKRPQALQNQGYTWIPLYPLHLLNTKRARILEEASNAKLITPL